MNLHFKISNEDFFKLLKHKVHSPYSIRYVDGLAEKVVFKETIDTLERIDNFAQEVSDDIWDAEVLISKFSNKKDQNQLEEFCNFFNGIRLQKGLFPHPEMFVHLFFRSVYETFKLLDQNLGFEIRAKDGNSVYLPFPKEKNDEYAKNAFILDSHQQLTQWRIGGIPYQRIAQLITQVRDQIDRGINEHRKQEINTFDKLNQQAKGFDHLLQIHSTIYVFAMDIQIQDFFKPRSDLLAQVGIMPVSPLADINLILASFPHLLSAITKVETYGTREDLNLHCILILKPSKNFSEKNSIAMLQQQIQKAVGDIYHVRIRNWNEVIRRNYSKSAVGLIKSSQPKNIEAFKYWILNFFFRLDLYIQPVLSNLFKTNLSVNHNLSGEIARVRSNPPEAFNNYNGYVKDSNSMEKVLEAANKACQPFLCEKELKSVWTMRNLPKTSQAYIEAVIHYFREIESDPKKVQSMMHIEIFIETLITTQLNAFELSVSGDHEVLSRSILRKAVTRLGRQFILLGEEQVGALDHPRHSLLSTYTFEKSRDISIELTGFKVARKTIEEVNKLILVLRRLYTTTFKEVGGRSIQEIKSDSYKKYKRRLDDVSKLYNHLLKRDSLIIRVNVKLIPKTGHISHPDLVILWTAFLHHAQRSKPLSWKTGFFGLWRVDYPHFYADVIFVFDALAVVDRDSIIQQLNDKWVKFINKKAQSKLKLNEKLEFKHCSIQGRPLMIADGEYASDHLFIESTNKARKSDFLQKIIPAFLSHSLFTEAYHEIYRQTGSGLLIKSSTTVASRKNAPTQKLMKKVVPKVSVDHSEIDEDQ
jgi:hypothetical protein